MLCGFGMEKDKYSRPSASSQSAKRRGVFLHDIELTPVPGQLDGLAPKEAWVESIYENYESFPMMRKGIAGTRLCVRLEESKTSNADKSESDDLYITVNGEVPKARGGVWDSMGVTLDFASHKKDPFANEGELSICETKRTTLRRFRYRIK